MHPDLFSLEALGDMIRIDEIRALHRDLHMRPFEAERRVYVIADAHLLNDDAADALLKDLEEPPPYAVIVLVADELGPIPPTIRSRCQLVPFRRLPERAIRELLAERAPGLSENEARALARVSGGRLDRAERLLDPEAQARREELLRVARSPYAEPELDPGRRRGDRCSTASRAAGEAAKERAEQELEGVELTSARARAAAAPGPARGRAGGAARGARGAGVLVPRPRRRRGRRRGGRRPRRPARAAARGRDAGAVARRGARRRARPRGLAGARGVQPEPESRAGGAVRAAEARIRSALLV